MFYYILSDGSIPHQLQLEVVKQRANDQLNALLESLDSVRDITRPNRSVKLVVYFDEAHELTQAKILDSDVEKSLYGILLSVLNDYRFSTQFFVLFLSTLSHVAHFAPRRELFRSARAVESRAHQPPITETPFDCYPNLLITQDEYDLRQVCTIEFMAKFGRPLYVHFVSTGLHTQLS